MKTVISAAIMVIAVIMAYFRYESMRQRVRANTFLLDFSDKLIKNNDREMLSFSTLFNRTYSEFFGSEVDCHDSESVFGFIKANLFKSENISEIISKIKKYTVACESELKESADELIAAASEGKKIAEKKFIDYGKLSFIIYPGISAMAVLILI